jgi:hypothetical protein
VVQVLAFNCSFAANERWSGLLIRVRAILENDEQKKEGGDKKH